jgi:ubiquinone/menaquinone biosynthesis C-methylase UbiE
MKHDDPDLSRARVYDDVADVYERVNAPLLFGEPARRLVAAVDLAPGSHLLDIGCGTGAVSRAALESLGGNARVVAIDPALAMVLCARRSGIAGVVVGSLPGLPFADASFDGALSAFVMSHVDDPEDAIREIARVVRPGGRIGLSAWYPADDDVFREWARVIREFIDPTRIEDAVRHVMPADSRFSKPGTLAALLAGAGLGDVVSSEHTVECAMTYEEYAESREICATGRALRILLSPPEWTAMRAAVRDALQRRFPAGLRFTRAFHVAVGARPEARQSSLEHARPG